MKTINQLLSAALLVGISLGFTACGGDDEVSVSLSAEELFIGRWDMQSKEFFECPDPTLNRMESCPEETSYCVSYEFFEDGTAKLFNVSNTQVNTGTYQIIQNSVLIDWGDSWNFEFTDNNTMEAYSLDEDDCRTKVILSKSS